MSTIKQFKLRADQIVKLIPGIGYCFATNKITVDGELVSYMYREEPEDESDSGWRFFSGTEDQQYADNPSNTAIYDVNTIANYDRAIIPYLNSPIGTELERVSNADNFQIIEQDWKLTYILNNANSNCGPRLLFLCIIQNVVLHEVYLWLTTRPSFFAIHKHR